MSPNFVKTFDAPLDPGDSIALSLPAQVLKQLRSRYAFDEARVISGPRDKASPAFAAIDQRDFPIEPAEVDSRG
jgi:hypothetical protein